MNLKHPFGWIKEESHKPVFVAALILTGILLLIFQILDAPLKTEVAPLGIVSFELVGNLSGAREIIASWGAEGELYAMFGLGFDYLFMFLYVITIGLGCVMIARKLSPEKKFMILSGVALAWGQIAAGLLDAVENYCLTLIILGTQDGLWAKIAQVSAVVKFIIIIAGILYLAVGTLLILSGKNKRASRLLN